MTDIEFMKMLIENHVLILTGPITDSLRIFGWLLISGLVSLVDGLENITTRIYSFNDFFNSKGVNDLLNAYKPLIYGIFIVALLFLGYSVMLQKKKDRSEIPTNILISAMIIIALPIFMTKLGDLTQMFVSYNISEQHSSAKEIVKDNVSDLYYLDRNNFKMNEKKNDIPTNETMNIDINETLNSEKITNKEFRDNFKRKISMDEKGNEKLVDLDKGFFGLFEEGYYRYNANFIIIIVSLSITGITLLCISLKVIGIIFELGFKKIFATIIAMADISDGRKLKAIVVDIMSSFAILMVTSVLLKMYIVFSAFLGSRAGDYSILSLVALAGVSWKVIDAPDIVERILGIDAGVKSNWASILAGYEGIKGAGRAIRGVGRLARKGFNVGKNAFSSLGDKGDSSQRNSGIYGSENSESNSTTSNINNNTNQSNTNSSNSKNNGSNMSNSNINRNGDANKNNNINRNNGIYNKAGDNINNNSSSKENSNDNSLNNNKEGNKGNSNINTDKGSSIYNKGNNVNDNNMNGNNGIYGDDNSSNISKDKGNSIYESAKNKTPNNENLNNNSNSINDKNNFNNKNGSTNLNSSDNNYSQSNNSNSSNNTGDNKFNIKDNSKYDLNNERNRNYRVGNQNKWNIKGKGNKK